MMKHVDLQNGYKPTKQRLHSKKNMAGPGKEADIFQDVEPNEMVTPTPVSGTLTGWIILEGTIMQNVALIGIDLGKHSFSYSLSG